VEFGKDQQEIAAVHRDAGEFGAKGAEQVAIGRATAEELLEADALVCLTRGERWRLTDHLRSDRRRSEKQEEREKGWPEAVHDG